MEMLRRMMCEGKKAAIKRASRLALVLEWRQPPVAKALASWYETLVVLGELISVKICTTINRAFVASSHLK